MARRRFIYVEGRGMVEVPLDYVAPRRRLAIHGVKEPFYSHADGLWYDDVRTYEREARALGYEIVGNEWNGFDLEKPKLPPAEDTLMQVAAEKGIDL